MSPRVCLALVVLLLFPPATHGAVTIGSDLSGSVDAVTPCLTGDHNCTVVQTTLPGRQLASPIDGVVVRVRAKGGGSPDPVRIRVVRPAGAGGFTGAGSVEVAGRSCSEICVQEIRLPIKTGDYVGLDAPASALAGIHSTPGGTLSTWSPFLGDGQTRPSDTDYGDAEFLLNADVEADSDADGFGDETQDLCTTTPNPTALAPCSPPTMKGRARNGETLTAESHATSTPASETFEWLRCNRGGSGCEPIDDAAAAAAPAQGRTYKLTTLDIGHAIRVSQTLTTPSGTATSVSPATQPVAPLPGRCTNRRSGTATRDRLIGTSGGDRLDGRGGRDMLKGGRGADCLLGRGGRDKLAGGTGRDRLVGGPGRDVLSGGPGRDVCQGDERDRFRSCERILGA